MSRYYRKTTMQKMKFGDEMYYEYLRVYKGANGVAILIDKKFKIPKYLLKFSRPIQSKLSST